MSTNNDTDTDTTQAYITVGSLVSEFSDTREESPLSEYTQRIRQQNNEIPVTPSDSEPWNDDVVVERYLDVDTYPATESLLKYARRKPPIVTGVATGKTGVIAGEPGSGKSMFALLMCCVIASGQEAMGLTPHNADGERVLFISMEEDHNEILLRWKALCQIHNIDTKRNIFFAGMDDVEFKGTGGIEAFVGGGYRDLYDLIATFNYKFVVIEPLSQMRLESEDNATHSLFFGVLSRLCSELDTTIFVVHHLRKPPPGMQSAFDANDIRGSSTILGAVRTLVMIAKLPRMGKRIYGYKFEKCQYSMPPEMTPYVFENEIVDTVWGSYGVGVIREYTTPTALPMPAHMLEDYRTHLLVMFEDKEHYRSNVQSSDWLGHTLALRVGVDIGTGVKSNERTDAQTDELNKLKSDLTKLVRLGMIETTVDSSERNNRTSRNVPVYIRGSQL